jgi:cytochrome c553
MEGVSMAPAIAGDAVAGRAKAARCVDCHGIDGVSPHTGIPNLAGQKETYLLKQLQEFTRPVKSEERPLLGDRKDMLMSHQAEGLSAVDLENLAAYFSVLPCGPAGASPKEPAPAKAARCAACHGEDGQSPAPAIPNLAGQKEAYLVRQLILFNAGARGRQPAEAATIRVHPIMNYQAALLDDADIRALARWYANLSCR